MSSFRTIELSEPTFESNGLRFLTVKTSNLRGRGDICLFVPELEVETTNLPIYILLHGVYGSAWAWAMKGGAGVTANRLIQNDKIEPAIIAMPSDGLWGDGSAYFPHHNKDFEQWIVNDVPRAIVENIPQAGSNSKLCIGGLSMGGYGALKLGAKYPKLFTAISGHSSITQLEQMKQFVEEPIADYLKECQFPNVIDEMIFNKVHLPSIRFDCGTSDPLIEPNRKLHEQLKKEHISHIYEEYAGGHEWSYWQEHLEKTLIFFDQSLRK